MGVLEQEQEAIAERGAAGLSSSKEEREHRHHEVLVMELYVVVGLLLVPDGREKGGSGVNEPLQGHAHTSLGTVLLSHTVWTSVHYSAPDNVPWFLMSSLSSLFFGGLSCSVS